MLTDLQIRDFAIIDQLHVSLRPGLNILTGETGAGKSIIVDAVNLLLGERASAEMVRSGAGEATVEALFDIRGLESLQGMLAELGIAVEDELLVRRTVAREGKNRVFIGGALSTLAILAEVTRELVTIYGQHEAYSLLKPEQHLTLLDGFAGLTPLRATYGLLYGEYRELAEELQRLQSGEAELARQYDLLSFQAREIEAAALQAGEEEELSREREILRHAERLFTASQGGFELLYGAEQPLLGQLARLRGELAGLTAIDPALTLPAETLEAARLSLEDVALQLRDYAGRLEVEPGRLQQVEERLDLLHRLAKKYGGSVAAVLEQKRHLDAELVRLGNREHDLQARQERLELLQQELLERGRELSAGREAAAVDLAAAMQEQLAELAMPNAHFTVRLEPLPEPKGFGLERGEFLFSPNPGEPAKPLAKVASGGELSRLMLALKQLHPESEVPTLVFDEVDTGISGATSALVGQKLQNVARRQQVLCITHLPQVAARADHHFLVSKVSEGGRTVTRVQELDAGERVAEVARLLGGVSVGATALENARELIEEGRRP